VCWRLARQLASEHGSPVSLWIDEPRTLAAIAPGAAAGAVLDGVAVGRWQDARPPARPRTVVVSAFGCELPAPVRRRLAGADATLWVNLEYLSAESWIDGCHGLASRKPDDGAIEHFFYPGFTETSGGLLRERGLIDARNAFRAGDAPQRWLARHGFDARRDERRISLFCYPDAPVETLLEILAEGPRATHLLVPTGVAVEPLRAFFGEPPACGRSLSRGGLRVERFDLLAQDDYDRLLWSCDLNFVRGEDSWIRAIWAGSPFVWQPYRQADDAHRTKLEAFLGLLAGPSAPARLAGGADDTHFAAAALMRAWDRGQGLREAWRDFATAGPAIVSVYAALGDRLAHTPDLATRLVAFCDQRLSPAGDAPPPA